jgi:hypothetical protein
MHATWPQRRWGQSDLGRGAQPSQGHRGGARDPAAGLVARGAARGDQGGGDGGHHDRQRQGESHAADELLLSETRLTAPT